MIYDTSPLSNPLFFFNAISLPNRKGVYQRQEAVLVCDINELQVVAFPSVCKRRVIIVKRLFGQYKAVEL